MTRVLSAAITTREEYSGGFVTAASRETASPATLVKALRRALGMRKAAPAPALPPKTRTQTSGRRPRRRRARSRCTPRSGSPSSRSPSRTSRGRARERGEGEGAKRRAEKELGTPQSETDAEAIETPEPRETDETDETEYVYERAEDAAAHRALLETLLPLLGSSTASNQHARTATVDAGAFPADADALLDAAVAAGAPEPPKPPDWIPPDELVEVVATRAARPDREPVTSFQILTPSVQPRRPAAPRARTPRARTPRASRPRKPPPRRSQTTRTSRPNPKARRGTKPPATATATATARC